MNVQINTQDGNHVSLFGDLDKAFHIEITDVLNGLSKIPTGSIQSVITSPPYWKIRDYGISGQLGLEPTWQEFIDNLITIFQEVYRVLKNTGTLWVNIGDTRGGGHGHHQRQFRSKNFQPDYPTNRRPYQEEKNIIGIPWRFAFAMQDAGWILRKEIIWHKINATPTPAVDRPLDNHEPIFMFCKKRKFFFDWLAGVEPADYDGRKTNHCTGSPKYEKQLYKTEFGTNGINKKHQRWTVMTLDGKLGRRLRGVWSIPSDNNKDGHTAPFPRELVRRCLVLSTSSRGECPICGKPWTRIIEKVNGFYTHIDWTPLCNCNIPAPLPQIVLDPFLGRGTTAIVSLKHGRKCYGIELNPKYAKLAKQNIYNSIAERKELTPEQKKDAEFTIEADNQPLLFTQG